MNINNMRL